LIILVINLSKVVSVWYDFMKNIEVSSGATSARINQSRLNLA